MQAASDHPGPIGAFFRRLRKRKKYNVAVIATVRKLVTIAYLILANNEPYRYAKVEVLKDKLTNCQRKAKLAPIQRRRSVRVIIEESPLNELYRQHQMPVCQYPSQWSAGERRALAAAEVTTFVEGVHMPPVITKTRKPGRKAT